MICNKTNIKYLLTIVIAISVTFFCSCGGKKDYESVEGDPMHVRIYTLDNGLKVYLSANDKEPKVYTRIVVNAGAKYDPAETTGLAHYLEHIMFKGTKQLGTLDYEKEKPLLTQIENLYEVYRKTTDSDRRKVLYHQIDSISHEASRYAIANEYDKLMALIGSDESNAATNEDYTSYEESFPSNQIENWAKVQSDRFKNMIIRGFHTELETVYEEYNMSLTNDNHKVYNKISEILAPNHPYGKHSIIGRGDHLKNPSIANIYKFFNQWYVPNNTAICISGDIDFDKTIEIIKKYFGDWKPRNDIDKLHAAVDTIKITPLTHPVHADIYGTEAAHVTLSWALPGGKSNEYELVKFTDAIISNNKAGLIDIDLNQSQKLLDAESQYCENTDISRIILKGTPKEGQNLDEVRDLLLAEIEKLKKGQFDEQLLTSYVNNKKNYYMQDLEDNEERVNYLIDAFTYKKDWKSIVNHIDEISHITKQQIVDFANKYFTDGYAEIYKLEGNDTTIKKIEKPIISPIEMNRNKKSAFLAEIEKVKVEPIQPIFADFKKDLSVKDFSNGDKLIYKKNETNQLFELTFDINRGDKADKLLSIADGYIYYLGTKTKTISEIQSLLYEIACNISFSVMNAHTVITISGLAENMDKALDIYNDWVTNVQPDATAYNNLVNDILKNRSDNKLKQEVCASYLSFYGRYGALNTCTNILSEQQLRQTNPQTIIDHLRDLLSYQKLISYYGPESQSTIENKLKEELSATNLKTGTFGDEFQYSTVNDTEILLAPFDAKNIHLMSYSNNCSTYNPEEEPIIILFNQYYNGGMSGIVFQEMREARGLCYGAGAEYIIPAFKGKATPFRTAIVTQNDKMIDAFLAFDEIIDNMPQSESSFNQAKEAVLQQYATNRTIRRQVISSYKYALRHGIDYDIDQIIYEKVKNMTLKDVVEFQQKKIKNQKRRYMILGNEKDLDIKSLEKIAPIKRLSLEDIFGY